MKVIHQSGGSTLIRFDKGEEVLRCMAAFSKEYGPGSFTAIGACGKVILSFYSLEQKKYLDKTFAEDREICAMIGNTAHMDGEIIVHTHGCFAGPDYAVVGGHIKELIVSATCEVTFFPLSHSVERKFDDVTGLKLLHCSQR